MYDNDFKRENLLGENDVVVVEDSKAGYQFFKKVCDNIDVGCIS